MLKGYAWYVKEIEDAQNPESPDYQSVLSIYQCPVDPDDTPTWFLSKHLLSKTPGTDDDTDFYSAQIDYEELRSNIKYPGPLLMWEVCDSTISRGPIPKVETTLLSEYVGENSVEGLDNTSVGSLSSSQSRGRTSQRAGSANDIDSDNNSLTNSPSSSYPSSPVGSGRRGRHTTTGTGTGSSSSSDISGGGSPRSASPNSVEVVDGDEYSYEDIQDSVSGGVGDTGLAVRGRSLYADDIGGMTGRGPIHNVSHDDDDDYTSSGSVGSVDAIGEFD